MISLYCKSLIQADCYCLLFEDFSKFGWISANTFTIKIFFAVNRRSLSSILIPFVCIVSYTAGSISSKTLQAFRKCPILVWHHDIKWRGCNSNISIASSNNSLFLMLLSKCLTTALRHSYSIETSATIIVLDVARHLITPDETCAAYR